MTSQLTIDGHEDRAPTLPAAFLEEWRRLEAKHRTLRLPLTCVASTVRLDAAGEEHPAAYVSFHVATGGTSYRFWRARHSLAEAARDFWRRSGRGEP